MTPDSGAAAPPVASSTADTARIALVGNPNSGKTALFNALTGSRQKVANYAGVTVERKEGSLRTPAGRRGPRLGEALRPRARRGPLPRRLGRVCA